MKARLPEGYNNGGSGNMNSMLKQAQKIQDEMAKVEEEFETKEFSASSGGGMVECKVNGKNEVLAVKINPEAVDTDDMEMLEDLVVAAVNAALSTASTTKSNEMEKISGGLNIPGIM